MKDIPIPNSVDAITAGGPVQDDIGNIYVFGYVPPSEMKVYKIIDGKASEVFCELMYGGLSIKQMDIHTIDNKVVLVGVLSENGHILVQQFFMSSAKWGEIVIDEILENIDLSNPQISINCDSEGIVSVGYVGKTECTSFLNNDRAMLEWLSKKAIIAYETESTKEHFNFVKETKDVLEKYLGEEDD